MVSAVTESVVDRVHQFVSIHRPSGSSNFQDIAINIQTAMGYCLDSGQRRIMRRALWTYLELLEGNDSFREAEIHLVNGYFPDCIHLRKSDAHNPIPDQVDYILHAKRVLSLHSN